jgi:hypothetical protein
MLECNMVAFYNEEANKIIDILQIERSFGRFIERSFGRVLREIQVNFRCSEVAHLV